MTEEDKTEKLSLMYAVCDVCSSTSAYDEKCESIVVNYGLAPVIFRKILLHIYNTQPFQRYAFFVHIVGEIYSTFHHLWWK